MQAAIYHEVSSVDIKSPEQESELYDIVASEVSAPTLASPVNNGDLNLTGFTRLPQRTPVDIEFENVTVTASLGFRKGTKQILHNINGRFPAGQLIAIMGPSGAGKSTLLDVLSGYKITGIGGNIYTNGVVRDLNSFRKISCYITQDDRLQPLVTVAENMKIAADLKLGTNVPLEEKEAVIDDILKTLGLLSAKNTRAARLSGGQKKRLSIALELINNPQVMFLDEPTTGLDSSSCSQCIKLLKVLAEQGRTIICTIHQPSAKLFELFDQVYVLASGKCLYQGSTTNLIRFLESVDLPCPQYHNPADYVIELACQDDENKEHNDQIDRMVKATDNGKHLHWLNDYKKLPDKQALRERYGAIAMTPNSDLHETSEYNQLSVLLRRGYIKAKRDKTLTYMRLGVNVAVGLMLGTLYWKAGSDGSKVLDNYNLLFSILIHHMMSPMMMTILTFPSEMAILIKEHFNRWYSLKTYYAAITMIDIPISVTGTLIFTFLIYYMTDQPMEIERVSMFAAISVLIVFVAESFGLMIGAVFNVVNGTFLGPTLSVPMMMFAGFGVTLKDLPSYLYWGSYISYLRYGLEGIVGAIYGLGRPTLECPDDGYCHYRYPDKFLNEISMRGDQFWNDIIALIIILFFLRISAFFLLKWKLKAVR